MSKTFFPENTKDKLYIRSEDGLLDLLDRIKEHFRLTDEDFNLVSSYSEILNNFKVSAEHIHTHCIGYDQYDSGDYTNYIVVERVQK